MVEDTGARGSDEPMGEVESMDLSRIMVEVGKWVEEVQEAMVGGEGDEGGLEEAWDDVHGGDLPADMVKSARKEEIDFMVKKGIWKLRPVTECWDKTGKAPVSVRWVDTNKGGVLEWLIRSRLVARDFKGGDKDRDDLFAETPPVRSEEVIDEQGGN